LGEIIAGKKIHVIFQKIITQQSTTVLKLFKSLIGSKNYALFYKNIKNHAQFRYTPKNFKKPKNSEFSKNRPYQTSCEILKKCKRLKKFVIFCSIF